MGAGGNRINYKVGKLSNTYTAALIDEVLEKYAYKNHKQEEVKNNYVQIVDESIVGKFDYENKRLISDYGNKEYNEKIIEYLRANTDYYGKPDNRGRFHKPPKTTAVLLREYVFYLPPEEAERFREDEDLFKAWCDDNLAWFMQEFPSFHVVCSAGHFRTERVPHQQLLFIPTGPNDGKLSNNKYFYDMDENGKTHKTGRIKQSEREQSYIATVLNKYGIAGGIKGSKATHRDLDEYCSQLKHEAKELEEAYDKIATAEAQEAVRLYQVEAEYNRLTKFVSALADVLSEIYHLIPERFRKKIDFLLDEFFNHEPKRGNER